MTPNHRSLFQPSPELELFERRIAQEPENRHMIDILADWMNEQGNEDGYRYLWGNRFCTKCLKKGVRVWYCAMYWEDGGWFCHHCDQIVTLTEGNRMKVSLPAHLINAQGGISLPMTATVRRIGNIPNFLQGSLERRIAVEIGIPAREEAIARHIAGTRNRQLGTILPRGRGEPVFQEAESGQLMFYARSGDEIVTPAPRDVTIGELEYDEEGDITGAYLENARQGESVRLLVYSDRLVPYIDDGTDEQERDWDIPDPDEPAMIGGETVMEFLERELGIDSALSAQVADPFSRMVGILQRVGVERNQAARHLIESFRATNFLEIASHPNRRENDGGTDR